MSLAVLSTNSVTLPLGSSRIIVEKELYCSFSGAGVAVGVASFTC